MSKHDLEENKKIANDIKKIAEMFLSDISKKNKTKINEIPKKIPRPKLSTSGVEPIIFKTEPLDEPMITKKDIVGPGILDQDYFDTEFSLVEDNRKVINEFHTTAVDYIKNNPEFNPQDIFKQSKKINKKYAPEAQMKEDDLLNSLIKILDSENIKHNLKPIRKKENTGGELVGGQKDLDLDKDGDLDEKDFKMLRESKQVGGMMMDDQMADMMQREELPALDNQMADMMPEEKTEEQKAIEKAQAPDEMMEENYVDFLIDEALSDDEEAMLMQELQANPQLSMLFDKVMEVAMEFSGSGPVEGPGTEVSDSIPARLSDGEFVFTAKSVDVIGADNLMSLMKQAEAQADQRQMAQEGGLMEEEETVMPVQQEPVRQDIRVTKETVGSQASVQEEDDLVGDELKKQMLSGRPHVRS